VGEQEKGKGGREGGKEKKKRCLLRWRTIVAHSLFEVAGLGDLGRLRVELGELSGLARSERARKKGRGEEGGGGEREKGGGERLRCCLVHYVKPLSHPLRLVFIPFSWLMTGLT